MNSEFETTVGKMHSADPSAFIERTYREFREVIINSIEASAKKNQKG